MAIPFLSLLHPYDTMFQTDSLAKSLKLVSGWSHSYSGNLGIKICSIKSTFSHTQCILSLVSLSSVHTPSTQAQFLPYTLICNKTGVNITMISVSRQLRYFPGDQFLKLYLSQKKHIYHSNGANNISKGI